MKKFFKSLVTSIIIFSLTSCVFATTEVQDVDVNIAQSYYETICDLAEENENIFFSIINYESESAENLAVIYPYKDEKDIKVSLKIYGSKDNKFAVKYEKTYSFSEKDYDLETAFQEGFATIQSEVSALKDENIKNSNVNELLLNLHNYMLEYRLNFYKDAGLTDIYKKLDEQENEKLATFLNDCQELENYSESDYNAKKVADFVCGQIAEELGEARQGDDSARQYATDELNEKAEALFGVGIKPDFTKSSYLKNGKITISPAKNISSSNSATISAVYDIGNSMYYIVLETTGPLIEEANQYYISDAIVKKTYNKSNELSFQLIKYTSDSEQLDKAQIEEYVANLANEVTISIDYTNFSTYETIDDFTSNLDTSLATLTGTDLSDASKKEIVKYIEYSIQKYSTTALKSKDNYVELTSDYINESSSKAVNIKIKFDKVLKKYSVKTNKTIDNILRISVTNLNFNKPIRIEFTQDTVDALGNCKGIKITLNDATHSIYCRTDDLATLVSEGKGNIIEIEKNDTTYNIKFLDANNELVDKINGSYTFCLPATSEYSTVYADYANGSKSGSDNWGGQYDSTMQTIEFSTKFTGQYKVQENKIEISDIGNLSVEHQRAINFMVAHGYFDVEDGVFNSDEKLTRYEFTKTLVGMFFALDKNLSTTFEDVEEDNEYYSYVASSEAAEIVNGYLEKKHKLFKGDNNITVEEVLAFCGRTLAEQKGYSYPDNPSVYLTFNDKDKIQSWSKEQIALCVQVGIVPNNLVELNPSDEISRADAALYLYNLFMLLYEVPIPFTEKPETVSQELINVGIIVAKVFAVVIVLVVIAVIVKKKNLISKFKAALDKRIKVQKMHSSIKQQKKEKAEAEERESKKSDFEKWKEKQQENLNKQLNEEDIPNIVIRNKSEYQNFDDINDDEDEENEENKKPKQNLHSRIMNDTGSDDDSSFN